MLSWLSSWLREGVYRCAVCGRPSLVHTPAQMHRCDRTPLPIVLTDTGHAWLREQEPSSEVVGQ